MLRNMDGTYGTFVCFQWLSICVTRGADGILVSDHLGNSLNVGGYALTPTSHNILWRCVALLGYWYQSVVTRNATGILVSMGIKKWGNLSASPEMLQEVVFYVVVFIACPLCHEALCFALSTILPTTPPIGCHGSGSVSSVAWLLFIAQIASWIMFRSFCVMVVLPPKNWTEYSNCACNVSSGVSTR